MHLHLQTVISMKILLLDKSHWTKYTSKESDSSVGFCKTTPVLLYLVHFCTFLLMRSLRILFYNFNLPAGLAQNNMFSKRNNGVMDNLALFHDLPCFICNYLVDLVFYKTFTFLTLD